MYVVSPIKWYRGGCYFSCVSGSIVSSQAVVIVGWLLLAESIVVSMRQVGDIRYFRVLYLMLLHFIFLFTS